ncbi:M81 family metallopeptidase [Pirellulales bacterium]|nr:M81 family metallopeptidase [Pirellulales bacterium]
MTEKPRIAVGGILTECNHFGGPDIDIAAFERYELRYGEQLLETDAGTVGGMLSVCRERGAEVVPLLFASTCPGGLVTSDCYTQLKDDLLGRLAESLPVDGVLLPLHGAMAAKDVPDCEGDLIQSVRQLVGPNVPIVATLDLHAQVTRAMVEFADALVAWETYPHRDAETTGRRGAELLLDALAGHCRPVMAMAKVPVVTGAFLGSTVGDGPFARLMRQTKSLEGQGGVLSTSLFLGHPYLDLPEMGSGGLVVADADESLAVDLANSLGEAYWEMRRELEPETYTPDQAVQAGLQIDGGPVLLVEAADCCGGGAAGDSVATLKALLQLAPQQSALVPVVDQRVADECHRLGIGGEITTQLGHQQDSHWGEPVAITGRIERLSDGLFHYDGGIWDGVQGNMGPTAIVSIGPIEILISSFGTYDWHDEQFKSVGLDPGNVKFLVVKNPMNFRPTYEGVAKATFVLDTPGPTPVTMKGVQYKRMSRPFFPADAEIPGLHPTLLLATGR